MRQALKDFNASRFMGTRQALPYGMCQKLLIKCDVIARSLHDDCVFFHDALPYSGDIQYITTAIISRMIDHAMSIVLALDGNALLGHVTPSNTLGMC